MELPTVYTIWGPAKYSALLCIDWSFAIFVFDPIQMGIIGYSKTGFTRALYKWIIIFSFNFLNLFILVIAAPALPALLYVGICRSGQWQVPKLEFCYYSLIDCYLLLLYLALI